MRTIKDPPRSVGKIFADNLAEGLGSVAGWVLMIVIVVLMLHWWLPAPRDDTDPPNGHSGLILKIDARTGCQYVGGLFDMTPRLDRQGKQICE